MQARAIDIIRSGDHAALDDFLERHKDFDVNASLSSLTGYENDRMLHFAIYFGSFACRIWVLDQLWALCILL